MAPRFTLFAHLALIVLACCVSVYAFNLFPEQAATHWNTLGQVDGFMPKSLALSIFPLIMVFIFVLWQIIPHLEPLKENLSPFRPWYDSLMLVLQVFLFYTSLLMILFNLGIPVDVSRFLMPAIAFLFGYIGILLPRTRRNWFIGIRTPWTLSNDTVWEKTHAFGARCFFGTAVIIIIGFFFPTHAVWFVLVPTMITVLATVGYSYFVYRNEL